jgi:hypothetical protein
VPTTNSCGYGDREDKAEAPLGRRRGHEERTPPPSLNPQRRMKWRVKEVTPPPLSPPRKAPPSLEDLFRR